MRLGGYGDRPGDRLFTDPDNDAFQQPTSKAIFYQKINDGGS